MIILGFLCSCQRENPGKKIQESSLEHHFKEVQKFPYYDTTTKEYQLLKAIYQNDTSYLVNYTTNSFDPEDWFAMRIYKALKLPALSTIGVDEAYRFNYQSGSFAYLYGNDLVNAYSITISKSDSQISLKGIWLESSLYDGSKNSVPYRLKYLVKFTQDTLLKLKNWDSLQVLLKYCDYWGLKPYNGQKGTDSSTEMIDGFIKGDLGHPAQSQHVYRWETYPYALHKVIGFSERLSGRTHH